MALRKRFDVSGVFLQHFPARDEDALRNAQRLVQVHDHRVSLVEEPDRILGSERRGRDDSSFKRNGAQRGSAYGSERHIAIGIDAVPLQEYSDCEIGVSTGAGDADDLTAQPFDACGFFAAEQSVVRVVG
jgi:hypothetical protein